MKRTLILLTIILSLTLTSYGQKDAFEFAKSGTFITVKLLNENGTDIASYGNNESIYLDKPNQISINTNFITNIEFQSNVRKEGVAGTQIHVIKIYINRNSGIQYYSLQMEASKYDFSGANKEYNRLLSIITK